MEKNSNITRGIIFLCLVSCFGLVVLAQSTNSGIKRSMKLENSENYIELEDGPLFKVDLRYATTNNFTGVNLYGEFSKAFLHRDAAKMIFAATKELAKNHPGYRILVFDALRPRSVQWKLWEKVKGTPQEMYVADPNKGSIHNYGLAVDCSLIDSTGKELDMGTPFDFFGPLAQPKLEDEMMAQGKLSSAQLENRKILRHAMEKSGFIQLPHEWWHYDSVRRDQLKDRYRIVE